MTSREVAMQALVAQVLTDPKFITDCAEVARAGLSGSDFCGGLFVAVHFAPELDRASVEIAAYPSRRRAPSRITFAIKLGQERALREASEPT